MKKTKIKSVGLRKVTTFTLWTLLIGSVLFGIYKNFTAIDQHTIHEEKVIETKLTDTNFVSSYVEEFAKVYFAWEPTKENLEQRTEKLKKYMNEDLQNLNSGMIRSDIPTQSIVQDVSIWNIEALKENEYEILFSVVQQVIEGESNQQIESAYSIRVKTDNEKNIVVASNPQMASLYKKLEQKNEVIQDDMAISQNTKDEIRVFLETFFKVYPTANKTELAYYISSNREIQEIQKGYIFSGIKSIYYFELEESVEVKIITEFLSPETKAIFNFEYELSLNKMDENWVIKDGI